MGDVLAKCRDYDLARTARSQGLYPYYQEFRSRRNGEVTLPDGRSVVMLGSNDYLGLSTNPRVLAAAEAALARYGVSCTGSRLLNGTIDLHDRLERELAEFLGKPAAAVTTTGFFTNLAVIDGLCKRGDVIVHDRLVHASIVDGMRLSKAERRSFAHNDPDDLRRKLAGIPEQAGVLVVVDGVYSMEGDVARLPELVAAVREVPGARLVVDDAHGFGVLGDGRGTCHAQDVTDQVDIITLTFSKSAGSTGGAILADPDTIEYLKHHARSIIFTASLGPPATAAALESLRIIRENPHLGKEATNLATNLAGKLRGLGYAAGDGRTPIVPIHAPSFDATREWYRWLLAAGVYTNPVGYPAASPRLRTSVMATHTNHQLGRVLDAFSDLRRFAVYPAAAPAGP